MQVYSVLAHDIMLCTWIWEVIHLYIVLDAFSDEAQAVFPYHYRVDSTLAYQEFALKVFRLVDEACPLIAKRISAPSLRPIQLR